MLTLKQINEASFRKSSFSGYKPEDVDKFIDEVTESYKTLVRENQTYKAKANELQVKYVEATSKNSQLTEKINTLVLKATDSISGEDDIKNILVNAQKLSSITMKDAQDKADLTISEANATADEIIKDAEDRSIKLIEEYQDKIIAKEKEYLEIKKLVSDFRATLYSIYKTHLAGIEDIPDFTAEIAEKKSNLFVEQEVSIKSEIEANEKNEADNDIVSKSEFANENNSEEFNDIDFDAFSDIPEALKKEKDAMFNTLEFGSDINLGLKNK